MSTKKKLDSYVQKELAEYENAEFFETLKSKAMEQADKRKHISRRSLVLIGASILTVIVLCLGIFLWSPWDKKNSPTALETQPTITEERQYLLEDEKTEIISAQEFFSAIQTMQFSEEHLSATSKVINTQYNEVLYYILEYNCSEFDNIIIYICNNDRYECDFYNHMLYNRNAEVNGYHVSYVELFSEEDGVYFFKTKGEINLEDMDIYFVYDGLGIEETSEFINYLSAIIE